jgi:hypothetical protein
VNDSKNDNHPSQSRRNTPPLNVEVHFPTPAASDSNKWNNATASERKANGQSQRLCNALSTPQDRVGGSLNPTWVEWLMGWPLGLTSMDPLTPDAWLAWRKAFPIASNDCEQLETDKCPQPQL